MSGKLTSGQAAGWILAISTANDTSKLYFDVTCIEYMFVDVLSMRTEWRWGLYSGTVRKRSEKSHLHRRRRHLHQKIPDDD
ncbi:hypothetical protein ACROYT_G007949 [Oculina patagonica]